MKKIVYILLICLIVPISLVFVGCDKNKYDAKNFYSDYQSIGNSATNLKLVPATDTYQLNIEAYKIDIDYVSSPKLSELVEDNATSYYYLKYFYQQLLDDSLSPVYFFGPAISSSSKITKEQAKELNNGLNSLKQNYEEIDFYIGALITSLTNNNAVNSSYLKKVFVQYENALTSANNLSSIVCDIYFGTVLSNPNYNYSAKKYSDLTNADFSRITIDTRARMYYYKSVYANIYHQLYVRNNNLADQLSSSSNVILPNYQPYTYIKEITSLNEKPSESLTTNIKKIYDGAVSLYNLQQTFGLAYNHFTTATKNIAYTDLKPSSSDNDKNYGNIISQFANGIAVDSYEILNNLINLLYN